MISRPPTSGFFVVLRCDRDPLEKSLFACGWACRISAARGGHKVVLKEFFRPAPFQAQILRALLSPAAIVANAISSRRFRDEPF
jgi:hypothetical protein